MTDLYADIGATPDMDEAEIRKAYRRKVKSTHPDAGGKAEDFHKVHRALKVLTDPKKREQYDRTGTIEDEPDNALAEVLKVLSGVVLEAVLDKQTGPDPTRKPLMPIMREIIARARVMLREGKTEHEDAIKAIESILGRFVPRNPDDEENVKNVGTIENLLRADIEIKKRVILEVEQKLETLDEVEKIISDVGFEQTIDDQDGAAWWKEIESQTASYTSQVRPASG